MGQYFVVVNHVKKQFLRPHAFGCGAKLREFGSGGPVMFALSQLLSANGSGRGFVGSWCGDSIGIHGDYASDGVYDRCQDGEYEDVSYEVIKELAGQEIVFLGFFSQRDVAEMPEDVQAAVDRAAKEWAKLSGKS